MRRARTHAATDHRAADVSGEPFALPMAPGGCTLDHSELSAQLARYRQLSHSVQRIDRHGNRAEARFRDTVDLALLAEAITVERGCCSFFALDYRPAERVLSVAVDPGREDALTVLLDALDPAAVSGR